VSDLTSRDGHILVPLDCLPSNVLVAAVNNAMRPPWRPEFRSPNTLPPTFLRHLSRVCALFSWNPFSRRTAVRLFDTL